MSANTPPSRCSTASPAAGPIGAGRAATSTSRSRRPRLLRRDCATCWPRQMAAPELAAVVQHRPALGLRHRRPGPGPLLRRPQHRQADASSTSRPTSTRSRTPASSSASTTTSSTRAASWTCGCARRACSSTAPAPAPTSPHLRGEGEPLSGGGKSSGLMSFLKIGDRAAGAIKSGGTTRRAAKMVVVDVDHPDIEDFINWKVKEEQKVAALVTGSQAQPEAPERGAAGLRSTAEGSGDDCFDPAKNPALQAARSRPRAARMVPTTTSSASSSSPSRATRTSTSRPTTPTGTPRPTSPSPARTPTTRCASPTTS